MKSPSSRIGNSLVLLICLFILAGATIGCKKAPSKTVQSPENPAADQKHESAERPSDNWAVDQWNHALGGGTQTLEETRNWLTGMYHAAKDQGLTSATSMQQWVTSDLQAQGDWQYKTIVVEAAQLETIDERLNQLGEQRWECFQVIEREGAWRFFLKRSKRSLLKNLPLRDLSQILPAINAGEN